MDTERQDYFRGSLEDSVLEFFRDYGVDCSSMMEERPVLSTRPSAIKRLSNAVAAAAARTSDSTTEQSEESEMGSVVGFKGQNLRGGLAFVAPTALVAHMLPVPEDKSRAELQLRDWSGEIANQLAGRLKNKLASRAFDFDVGTAVCFRGMSIRLSFLQNTEGVSLSFSIAEAGVRVYLDCSFVEHNGDVDEANAMRIVPEGDVVLF